LSVFGGDHNRLTFNSLRLLFPGSQPDVSIPPTESGNGVGSVAKDKQDDHKITGSGRYGCCCVRYGAGFGCTYGRLQRQQPAENRNGR
jgi:hypothetical protein